MHEDKLNVTVLHLVKTALIRYDSLVNAWGRQGKVSLRCGLWL